MTRSKFKKEDYNKDEPSKDATKYYIVYEGVDKEPNYFEAFNESFLDKKTAYLHHVLEKDTGVFGSNPKKLKERAEAFLKNPPKTLKIKPQRDDKFRFVLDVDFHPVEQILELKKYCEELPNASLYISNYCFEVWLWSHFEEPKTITSRKPSELKTELHKFKPGNYPFCYMNIKLIEEAIKNCEKADLNKTEYFPVEKSSKIYILIKELLMISYYNTSVEQANHL